MSNGSEAVDNMQNELIKALERKSVKTEERLNQIENQFAELMGKMDLIIKGIKWLAGAVALGLGIDAHGFMEI
tara:strand:- start:103 stop:321 length:219 start_codon:yes stop_codon:yes gene_type:complete